jgi:hypothetical protein
LPKAAFDLFSPICFEVPVLSRFCIGARVDITTLTHFVGGLLSVYLFYFIFRKLLKDADRRMLLGIGLAAGIIVGEEIAQASCSSQGFDLIDLISGFLGLGTFLVLRKWINASFGSTSRSTE